nr:SHOCT domain-containing protein [Leucobacter soli]
MTPAPPAAAPAGSSVLDQLTQLGQLRDAGVLTETEFETQKQRILASA